MSTLTDRIDAQSLDELQASGTLKWTQYPETIGAWVAEHDFPLADPVSGAIHEMVDRGLTAYAPPALRAELPLATAAWLGERHHWDVDPTAVHWLPDVLTGLAITFEHFAPAGKVIVPTPAYMPFVDMPATHGRDLIQVPLLRTESGWDYDFDAIDAAFADGGAVLILCNPQNPTGKVSTRGELEKLCEIVERHHGMVFSDEIHAPLVYSGHEHISYASINPVAAAHTVTALSASKAFNVAGLKCAELVLTNQQQNQWYSSRGHGLAYEASPLGMAANIAAFRDGGAWLDEIVGYLQGNRDLAVARVKAELPQIDVRTPDATFLLWLDTSSLDAANPQEHFLKAGVALNDGAECGDAGQRWVRFNFGTTTAIVNEALDRMVASLR